MHLGFSAASAVVTAPSSSDGSTCTLRSPQDFVARDNPGGVRFPRFGVLAGRNDRGGPTGGNGVVTLAGVEGTIGSDAGDLLFGRALIAQFGQREAKGYIGERYDADAGLLYLNARYYDPRLGMFLQPDWWEVMQAGVGTNRYSYSFNDPINNRDPSGNGLLGHVDKWRSHRRIDVMSMKPRMPSAVLS